MTRLMKISLALSTLILVVAASYQWHGSQRLEVVRENYTKLAAEAASFGITLDPARPSDPVRITRRERENKDVDAKATATDLIAFAKEMEARGSWNGLGDEAQQKRTTGITSRMISLDSAQLKLLIAEVRAAKDLKDQTRQNTISFALMTLSNDHPQAVLALFTESPDLLKDPGGMSGFIIPSSLAKWAKEAPLAALDWVQKNGEKFPDLITDQTKIGMLAGTAANDPKLALKLIGDFKIKDALHALSQIASSSKTPVERTATLTALRDYLTAMPDEKARKEATDRSIGGLARGLAEDGFASANQWIAGANLTPTELENIADDLNYPTKSDETGQWIDWIGEKLPAEKSEAKIRDIVGKWTERDYQAAGKWLVTTPASPTKNTAIRSYAETVSQYDPATATQWAMTLPPGPDRDATLKHIQDHSPTQ